MKVDSESIKKVDVAFHNSTRGMNYQLSYKICEEEIVVYSRFNQIYV